MTYKNAQIWHCKFCNIDIISRRKFFEHLKTCEAKLKLPHDSRGRYKNPLAYEKSSKTRKELFLEGKLNTTKGNKLSDEHKFSISEGTKKYLKQLPNQGGARFSLKACKYIDKLNEQKGWHLQHGLNGGEVTCGPYYLDGYDKDLNIAFEYDELKHHYDCNGNLCEHDKEKMEYIKKQLGCRFFRYNEKLDLLYEC